MNNMLSRVSNLDRKGISLVEILISIMVLGIGVISLATLFPIGLLQMRRAVNDVRGTIVAQTAWNEVKVRNLLAPPFGPPAFVFSEYPSSAGTPITLSNPPWAAFVQVTGPGLPVIIDPLWMVQTSTPNFNIDEPLAPKRGYFDSFGFADLDGNGVKDFAGGEGVLRVRGGSWVPPPAALPPYPLELASEIFSSHDDLAYGEADKRMLPLQDAPGATVPYFAPTYGVPFSPGSLFRERRYTWMIVARKVGAGQIYNPGPDGLVGTTDDIRENVGPDGIPNAPPYPPHAPGTPGYSGDDPARDMATGYPVPAPVGPFDVTIVAFYTRDYSSREAVYANLNSPNPGSELFVFGTNVATLIQRPDVPFPEVSLGSYIMDTTFDSTSPTGRRNGFVYRVTGKDLDPTGTRLYLTLDQPARATGWVLTTLKGAVGVFEKQVP